MRNNILYYITLILLVSRASKPLSVEKLFTPKERDYIASSPAFKASAVAGAAPFSYTDKSG